MELTLQCNIKVEQMKRNHLNEELGDHHLHTLETILFKTRKVDQECLALTQDRNQQKENVISAQVEIDKQK